MRKLCLVTLAALFVTSAAAWGASATIRHDPADPNDQGQDTPMLSYHPDANGGDRGRFDLGRSRFDYPGCDQSGLLHKWDLRSLDTTANHPVSGLPQAISGVSLELFYSSGNNITLHDVQMLAYPLAAAWQEGTGNAGTRGDGGEPYGDTAIGDVTYKYKQVTAVEAPPGTWTNGVRTNILATDGVEWDVHGARGIGTDVLNQKLIDQRACSLHKWNASTHREAGSGADRSFALMHFTPGGKQVVQGWIDTPSSNHGLSLWAEANEQYAFWFDYQGVTEYYAFMAPSENEYPTEAMYGIDGSEPDWWWNEDARPALTIEYGVPGDAGDDGYVSGADYTVWAGNYDPTGGTGTIVTAKGNYEVYEDSVGYARATLADGDFTGDGLVTGADYTIWAGNYTGAPPNAVPEPTTIVLLGVGLAGVLRRRRQS